MIGAVVSGAYAYRGLASRDWPHVAGHVIHSHYEVQTSEKNPTYIAEIQYAYRVQGKDFTNNDLGFERLSDEEVVRDLIRDHPDGSAISVYFRSAAAGPFRW